MKSITALGLTLVLGSLVISGCASSDNETSADAAVSASSQASKSQGASSVSVTPVGAAVHDSSSPTSLEWSAERVLAQPDEIELNSGGPEMTDLELGFEDNNLGSSF